MRLSDRKVSAVFTWTCALLCAGTMSMSEYVLSVTSDTRSYVGAHLPKSKNTNRLSESF